MYLYQEAEKRIKDIYWNETHDSHSKLNLPGLVEEYLIKDNQSKDPDYYNHREGVVHVSSLYRCLRGVVHEMLGAKKDNEIQVRKLGVFKAGNLFEDFIINCLDNKIVHKQREYEYKYKGITLVGRSDYTIDDNGTMRVGENKSVHSDSFWMREKEGTLIAWHNQIQLMTYLWLERILEPFSCTFCEKIILTNVEKPECRCLMTTTGVSIEVTKGVEMTPTPEDKINNPHGIFSYISKDDCTVIGAPIQFNPHFVDEIIVPTLDIINEGYTTKNPETAPLPPMVIFSEAKHQYQKNWLASYCEFHFSCAGAGWVLEAMNLVTQRNKELKKISIPQPKKIRPKIEIVG